MAYWNNDEYVTSTKLNNWNKRKLLWSGSILNGEVYLSDDLYDFSTIVIGLRDASSVICGSIPPEYRENPIEILCYSVVWVSETNGHGILCTKLEYEPSSKKLTISSNSTPYIYHKFSGNHVNIANDTPIFRIYGEYS